MEKPLVRTIHHLGCSGGSIFSKCKGAMSDVIVLSEGHPHTLRFRFDPFDPVQLSLAQTNLQYDDGLKEKIFLQRIRQAFEIARSYKRTLVLRDHAHSDFLAKQIITEKGMLPTLLDVISRSFRYRPVLTVRNPIDSFLSLKKRVESSKSHV